jgi:hypothetical protein
MHGTPQNTPRRVAVRLEWDRPYAIGTSRMSSIRLLWLPQVIERTGLKKTKLYDLQKEGDFPMRISLVPTTSPAKRTGRVRLES